MRGASTKRFFIQCLARSSRSTASEPARGTEATEISGGTRHLAGIGRTVEIARIAVIEATRERRERREARTEVLRERIARRQLAHRRRNCRERVVGEHEGHSGWVAKR